jgi:uncharacterized protein (TIGR02217 family)
MAFHDTRLPDDIERGAVGGPMFKTTVLELESGFEQRNIDWSQVRGEWDISYGVLAMEDNLQGVYIHQVRDFFYARNGKAHSFRFKDWSDFEIGDPGDPAADNQIIGLGDDATSAFQVFKRYGSGGYNYDRTITKLVAGTYFVYLDGALQTEATHYTVDLATGVVTFVTPPASTGGTGPGGEQVVSIATEFDLQVRFDVDHLQMSVLLFNVGSIPNMPLREVRLET